MISLDDVIVMYERCKKAVSMEARKSHQNRLPTQFSKIVAMWIMKQVKILYLGF